MTHTAAALDSIVEGAINFRDIGGYPRTGGGRVRTGVVYRSAMTHHITPAGFAALKEQVGLKVVLDLRNAMELELDGLAPFAEYGIVYHNAPVSGETSMTPEERNERIRELSRGDVDWGGMYAMMLSRDAGAYHKLFGLVGSDEHVPLVFHCTGGRDRTGVGAALLLSTMGVSDDDVARDYALTGGLLKAHIPRFQRHIEQYGMSEEEWGNLVETSEEAMHQFLEHIRTEYGSSEEFMLSSGAMEETIARVKAALSEG